MFNQPNEYPQRSSAFRKPTVQTVASARPEFNMLAVAGEMLGVINTQNALILKLLQRQAELCQELDKRNVNSSCSSGSQNKGSSAPSKVSGYRELTEQEQVSSGSPLEREPWLTRNNVEIISGKGSSKTTQSQKAKSEEHSNSGDIEPQQISDNKGKTLKKKQTQTKNMVKNFSKSIFYFIRKNKEKRLRILSYLGISDQDFMKMFDSLRGHIHSISQLRNLWTPEGNVYHKAFRILSCEYLRKYCLQRTFNSRVENYLVHLKYRKRLIDSLKSPEEFTVLKTN